MEEGRPFVRKRASAGGAALGWGLLAFATLQAVCGHAVDGRRAEIRHPEYGRKLALLKSQATDHAGKPLLLAMGTSRTVFGFCASAEKGEPAWQFNFGLTGVGPVQQLVCFRRLLDSGVRPAQLLFEIHPAFLNQTRQWCEARAVDVRKLNWRDFIVMRRYAYEPRSLTWRWLMSRLSPWYTHRAEILWHIAPSWFNEASRPDERMLAETDACGWSRFPVRPADTAERRRLERLCADLYSQPMHDFEVSDVPRRAIDELLDICREERIAVALVLMPEGAQFRERYTEAAMTQLHEYLVELQSDYPIEVFDCRAWCADEQLCDGQHLLPEGAQAFTARLQGQRLVPWLAAVGRANAELAQQPSTGLRKN